MSYVIESAHTPEEGLRALDEMNDELLNKSFFACSSGVHGSWAIVEAPNESAARNMVPAFLRDKARIFPMEQFTREQIKSFHEM